MTQDKPEGRGGPLNPYEMTFIVRPDLDEEQIRAAIERLTGRLQSAGGEIIATYPWNPPRRRMTYPIREFGDAYYVTTTFNFDPEGLKEFERGLRLNTDILRFLIVQATAQMIQQSQQRQQQHAARAAAPPPQPTPAPAPQAPVGTTPEQSTPQSEPQGAPQPAAEAAPEEPDVVPTATQPEAATEPEPATESEPVATGADTQE